MSMILVVVVVVVVVVAVVGMCVSMCVWWRWSVYEECFFTDTPTFRLLTGL